MGATKEQCSSPAAHFPTASHHPLFSIAATSILIAFLYVPRPLLINLIFSPALIATLLLLAALHRFGSSAPPPQAPQQTSSTPPSSSSSPIHHQSHDQQQQKPRGDLVEWERPAAGWPLDVIYEEYEGAADGDSSEYSAVGLRPFGVCFTDSDSGSDDDDDEYLLALEGRDSLEFLCFRWEEEGEGMIEIELEEEEDNLIEIDISGCRR